MPLIITPTSLAGTTYLALVQKLRQEAEIAGSGPTTVTGQSGQLARLVTWVTDAYKEIQNRHPNWRWLRSTFTVNTVAGTDAYAPVDCTDSRLTATITRFAQWWVYDEHGYPNFKIYLSSGGVGGERWLTFLPWSDFRAVYRIGTQNNGAPAHFTIDPQNKITLGPKPDAVYVLSGEYQMGPQILAADSDIPEMPGQFHDLIVYRALARYGLNSVAQEAIARSEVEGTRMLRALEANQLPQLGFAAPLV